MAETLFFYDLETTGLDKAGSRIMQFAGQRTDLNLALIGPQYNYLIKLTKDVLPDPQAVLVHGITPQKTIEEGLSEAEFLKIFYDEIVVPNTTFVGFNNLEFDDDFMRYLNYRNLYDPYRWAYANNCSRWDLLGLVRLTRALRPDGINWPIVNNKITNRLELLTKYNNLEHSSAHDAYSDVLATINVASLIRDKQPKLFDFLYRLRRKEMVKELLDSNQSLVYIDKYLSSDLFHTTVIVKLADRQQSGSAIVFDLRNDPSFWLAMSESELEKIYYSHKGDSADHPWPFKFIKYNQCPVLAPMGVIKDQPVLSRLQLNLDQLNDNLGLINRNKVVLANKLFKIMDANNDQTLTKPNDLLSVDYALYDSFIDQKDLNIMNEIHKEETPSKVRSLSQEFSNPKLQNLTFLYLARNYFSSLSSNEIAKWDEYMEQKLYLNEAEGGLKQYFAKINHLYQTKTDAKTINILEDLRLYGESLIPSDFIS